MLTYPINRTFIIIKLGVSGVFIILNINNGYSFDLEQPHLGGAKFMF